MPFEIRLHPEANIVEVIYPERPTAADVNNYVVRITKIMDAMNGPWGCLVDQRSLVVMAPELVDTVSHLNSYALAHGMVKSARVVTGAVAALQVSRMAREANVTARTFDAREPAISWLRQKM